MVRVDQDRLSNCLEERNKNSILINIFILPDVVFHFNH
jgi:hypothetical protein